MLSTSDLHATMVPPTLPSLPSFLNEPTNNTECLDILEIYKGDFEKPYKSPDKIGTEGLFICSFSP